MKKCRLLFSVTAKDFTRKTFSVGGHGGGGKDTSNRGVRLTHTPSGASAEGRSHRTNSQNQADAFKKILKHPKFLNWHRIECARALGNPIPETPEQVLDRVDRMIETGLKSGEIKIEE